MSDQPLSAVESIKTASRRLRGTIAESLADPLTGAMREDDTHLIKFHGIYQQDDRDLRAERRVQRLEPAYQFMIRARLPAGICTPAQWLAMDEIARTYANGTLRLTTRQTFQFHGVLKRHLQPSIAAINRALMDTLAACGDVNRNVMGTTLAQPASVRPTIAEICRDLSASLSPQTRAYHEIWLDGTKIIDTSEEREPLYGDTYLPRKFKIGVAVPPNNDVDLFTQDLGFIALIVDAELRGFNVTVGGGLGMSHGEFATYPRVADVLGYINADQVLATATAVLTTQRDFGDRTNRKHARLKYTIDTLGLARFKAEVEARLGWSLRAPEPFNFTHHGDRQGWHVDADGAAHFTLCVPSGRIADTDRQATLTALRDVATRKLAEFHLTPNQNVVLAYVSAEQREELAQLLHQHGLDAAPGPTRGLALACVGLPTCGLAMAESERYLDDFVTRMESLLQEYQLADAPITVRITGCPNGCARPYVAEIALVGKAPGRYNLYLGGAFNGTRLNAPYRESLSESDILAALRPLLAAYAESRAPHERFGDFLVRRRIVPTLTDGRDFSRAARELASARGGV